METSIKLYQISKVWVELTGQSIFISVQDGGGSTSRTEQSSGHRPPPLLSPADHVAHLQVILWANSTKWTSFKVIEQHILGTNVGKQLSYAATDVLFTLMLKRMNNI